MSELILPPGYKREKTPQKPPEPFEPYPDEIRKLAEVGNRLNQMFAWTGEEATTERQFEMTARNLFGEAGFEIFIEWMQAMDQETGEELPFKAPSITLVGRIKKEEETDHDRIKWGVTKGLLDGQAGYIREDGSKHEDPIKRIIT